MCPLESSYDVPVTLSVSICGHGVYRLQLVNNIYKNFHVNTSPLMALLSENYILFHHVDTLVVFSVLTNGCVCR